MRRSAANFFAKPELLLGTSPPSNSAPREEGVPSFTLPFNRWFGWVRTLSDLVSDGFEPQITPTTDPNDRLG